MGVIMAPWNRGPGNEKDFEIRMMFSLGLGESLPNKVLTLESQDQKNQFFGFAGQMRILNEVQWIGT